MTHHPQTELMTKYSIGDVPSYLASMVSAHLDLCEECRLNYSHSIKKESHKMELESYDLSDADINDAFEFVMKKISLPISVTNENQISDNSFNVGGQVIQLPRSLNFLKERQILWKEFGKNNAIAPIAITPQGNLYLIYIGPGERVPEHNHSNIEYSYVVAGSYDDGHSVYNTGDLSFSNHETSHSPMATSDDGCLVVSWVEGRLNYFGGFLKPLNSILWWYLHRA